MLCTEFRLFHQVRVSSDWMKDVSPLSLVNVARILGEYAFPFNAGFPPVTLAKSLRKILVLI